MLSSTFVLTAAWKWDIDRQIEEKRNGTDSCVLATLLPMALPSWYRHLCIRGSVYSRVVNSHAMTSCHGSSENLRGRIYGSISSSRCWFCTVVSFSSLNPQEGSRSDGSRDLQALKPSSIQTVFFNLSFLYMRQVFIIIALPLFYVLTASFQWFLTYSVSAIPDPAGLSWSEIGV